MLTIARVWAVSAALAIALGACASNETNTGNGALEAPDAGNVTTNGTGGSTTTQPTSTSTNPDPPPTGGSCDPTFCPSTGFGDPCCTTANGPCGFDMGMGCVSSIPGAADGG